MGNYYAKQWCGGNLPVQQARTTHVIVSGHAIYRTAALASASARNIDSELEAVPRPSGPRRSSAQPTRFRSHLKSLLIFHLVIACVSTRRQFNNTLTKTPRSTGFETQADIPSAIYIS